MKLSERTAKAGIAAFVFIACDAQDEPLGSQIACSGVVQEVACVDLEGVPGPPVSVELEFSGSGAHCAEVRQLNEKPNRASSIWVQLNHETKILAPSSFSQNSNIASASFEVSEGSHNLTMRMAGTKRGHVELCAYKNIEPQLVSVVESGSAGSYHEPVTGFTLEWPEGAVAEDTGIWCVPSGEGVSCGPDGTQFQRPVVVSFPYTVNKDKMLQGLAPTVVRDGQALPTARMLGEGRAYSSTNHFTGFSLQYTIPASLSGGFGFFNTEGGSAQVPHSGAVRGLAAGDSAVIAFRKEEGHRYTVVVSSPPEFPESANSCEQQSFPAGNVDLYGYWIDPEIYETPELLKGVAKENGWYSEKSPGFATREINWGFDKNCVYGVDDAFSVGPIVKGGKPFYIQIDGVWPQDNYFVVRITDVDMRAAPNDLIEEKLTWPMPGLYEPTAHGPFNTAWGNVEQDPFYWTSGYELDAEGSPYYKIHDGVDIEAPEGTPVIAACSGVISRSESLGDEPQGFGWGDYLVQKCDGALAQIVYNHISSDFVQGDVVQEGEFLGEVVDLELPGEPDHLHLGICLGEEVGSAGEFKCHPQLGATRDKWFPYGNKERHDESAFPHINPDICTNPKIWKDPPSCD